MGRISLFIVGMVMLFQACDEKTSVEDYEKEIEDAVTYYVAKINFIATLAKENQEHALNLFDGMDDEILKMYRGSDETLYDVILEMLGKSNNTFHKSILKMSQWDDTPERRQYAKLSKRLLKFYDETYITLTEYKVVLSIPRKKIWKFTELNSGIDFTFKLSNVKDIIIFTIEPEEKSMKKYYESLFD